MDSQFTDDEKRFMLSEIIKQSRLDVDILVDLVRGFEPDWMKMPLPHGRTLQQCLQAADGMFQTTVERPNLKRKPMGDMHELPPKRRIVSNSLEHSAQSSPLSLSAQLPASSLVSKPAPYPSTQHVNIQPRFQSAGPPPPGQTQLAPSTRRRGRPSRADKATLLRPMLPQLAPRAEPQPIAPQAPMGSPDIMPSLGGYSQDDPTRSPSALGPSFVPSPVPQPPPKPARKRGRPSLADKASKAASYPRAPDPDA